MFKKILPLVFAAVVGTQASSVRANVGISETPLDPATVRFTRLAQESRDLPDVIAAVKVSKYAGVGLVGVKYPSARDKSGVITAGNSFVFLSEYFYCKDSSAVFNRAIGTLAQNPDMMNLTGGEGLYAALEKINLQYALDAGRYEAQRSCAVAPSAP